MDPVIRAPLVRLGRRALRPAVAALSEPAPLAAPGSLPIAPATAPTTVPTILHTSAAPMADMVEPHPTLAMLEQALQRQRQELESAWRRRSDELESEAERLRGALAKDAEHAMIAAQRRGQQEGLAQGLEEGRACLAEETARLRALCEELSGLRAELARQAADEAIVLAHAALCKLLGSEAAARCAVADAVRASAGNCGVGEALAVSVHPDDVALFRDWNDARVSFVANTAVRLGGCLVESSAGTLDARFETQVARLEQALRSLRGRRAPGEAGA